MKESFPFFRCLFSRSRFCLSTNSQHFHSDVLAPHTLRDSDLVSPHRFKFESALTLCQGTANNGIASFCLDNRWRQVAIFVFVKIGKGPTFRINHLFCVQSLILYYVKHQKFHVAMLRSVIDHRRRQTAVRTPRLPLLYTYHILASSVIIYWTDARQHGIYFFKYIIWSNKE